MSDEPNYDVIVIGVGSMGAATCYHLAKRGYKVLGLEQFDMAHDQGSHGGQTRIIRKAYGEDTRYVPLLLRAYDQWAALEQRLGEQVFYRPGILYFGQPGSEFMSTLGQASEAYGIQVESLSNDECSQRHPQFSLPADYDRVWEPDAGFLLPERAVRLMAKGAIANGADIFTQAPVRSWRRERGQVIVETEGGTYTASKLVITAGAWLSRLVPDLAPKLTVTRQSLAWVQPKSPTDFVSDRFPCWLVDGPDGVFYGFPIVPDAPDGPIGLKIGRHQPIGEETDPDHVDRSSRVHDEEVVVDFLKKHIPKGYDHTVAMKTCLYTNTPDHDFIIDYVPGTDGDVCVGGGFSGHGFKFAIAVGEALADMALEGGTTLSLGFLGVDRLR